jgi:hypoxanthine phosphoribosyltransferase
MPTDYNNYSRGSNRASNYSGYRNRESLLGGSPSRDYDRRRDLDASAQSTNPYIKHYRGQSGY